MDSSEFDVVVVGAGLSGIAAAHYLRTECPDRSFVLLEGRDAIGGTWDLFRYPGVRSDSDMCTLGYSFRPWASNVTMAQGPLIREYVQETARTEGTLAKIRFGHRVTAAHWDSATARWSVEVSARGQVQRFGCRFLYFCSGYYDYAQGHDPDWPGRAQFGGRIVHPQHWPEDLDYTGKRVVVVGSGATAVTLVPAMAQQAAHVTMLQRSPSYILAVPGSDVIGAWLRRVLPAAIAHPLVRWKNILVAAALFRFSRGRPEAARRWLIRQAQARLGPEFDARHLQPPYAPWDQRMCFVPDADFFEALRSGRADIVTDALERFTPEGVQLASGQTLPADIVVTATGLKLKMLGGAQLTVDGRPVHLPGTVSYQGMMLGGVPNLANAMGYTNASWTLKSELIARKVCRILNHMRDRRLDIVMPVPQDVGETRPLIDLSSGYVRRSAAQLPRQASRKPWRVYQSYIRDLLVLKLAPLSDGALRFARAGEALS